jgi:hypothetical protein
MNRLPLLLLALLPAALRGQSQDPQDHRDRRVRQRIEAEVAQKRDAMREGRVIRTNAAVKVRLKNGSRLGGVIKNERLVELPDSLDFVQADIDTPGAGLRIWYYDNTNSYIFLRYSDVQSYRIEGRLTDVEVKAIEARIEEAKRKAEQQRLDAIARAQGKREGDPKLPDPDAEQKAKEAADKLAAEEQLLQLLTEFPPEQGWGEGRARQIEAKKITLGVYPDPKSKRFLDIFSDWQKALKIREQREAERQKQEEQGGTPPPDPVPQPPVNGDGR